MRLLLILLACKILCAGCGMDHQECKVLFAGDLMPDRGTREIIERHGTDFLFAEVKKITGNPDIAIANFECVACDASLEPQKKRFTFRAEPEWLSAIKNSGFAYLNIANNHSFDFGAEGLRQTANNFQQHGITALGYHADNSLACLPAIIEMKGSKIAVFSSSLLIQNETSCTCKETAAALSERIKLFKKNYPLHIVFVNLHWGGEMRLIPAAEQTGQAHLLIDAGADAVVGHHPHIVQTIEVYKEKLIFYSVGNFIFDNDRPNANRGILLTFLLSGLQMEGIQIRPFNIVTCRPEPMTSAESLKFMQEINTVSPTVKLKQIDGNWEIL